MSFLNLVYTNFTLTEDMPELRNYLVLNIDYIYIYFACLSERAQILCGTSHDPREG